MVEVLQTSGTVSKQEQHEALARALYASCTLATGTEKIEIDALMQELLSGVDRNQFRIKLQRDVQLLRQAHSPNASQVEPFNSLSFQAASIAAVPFCREQEKMLQ